jgi:hypothetical protein
MHLGEISIPSVSVIGTPNPNLTAKILHYGNLIHFYHFRVEFSNEILVRVDNS